MWNPRNFKDQVSPHELLQVPCSGATVKVILPQAIQDSSEKKFKISTQGDPLEFLQWFLNALHKDLGGTKKPNSSIIYRVFQGEIQVETEVPSKPDEPPGNYPNKRFC